MKNHVISAAFLVTFGLVSTLAFNEKPTYIESIIIYFMLLIHSIVLDIKNSKEEAV
jgi:hypothetical protein